MNIFTAFNFDKSTTELEKNLLILSPFRFKFKVI